MVLKRIQGNKLSATERIIFYISNTHKKSVIWLLDHDKRLKTKYLITHTKRQSPIKPQYNLPNSSRSSLCIRIYHGKVPGQSKDCYY